MVMGFSSVFTGGADGTGATGGTAGRVNGAGFGTGTSGVRDSCLGGGGGVGTIPAPGAPGLLPDGLADASVMSSGVRFLLNVLTVSPVRLRYALTNAPGDTTCLVRHAPVLCLAT